MYGVLAGLATAAGAGAGRPRGGTAVLFDGTEAGKAARARRDDPAPRATSLATAEKRYRAMAAKLEKPLLDFVGGLPAGVELARFAAVDWEGWLDLNLNILLQIGR